MIHGLSEKLRLLRIQNNLSQSQVAKRINSSSALISAYECAERNPSLENLIALAELFHVSTDYLLGIGTTYSSDNVMLDTTGLNRQQLIVLQDLINTMR